MPPLAKKSISDKTIRKNRLQITLIDQQHGDNCTQLLKELEKANGKLLKRKKLSDSEEVLFVRDGRLVVVREDEQHNPRITIVNEPILRQRVCHVVDFYHSSTLKTNDIHLPKAILQDLLNLKGWKFPPLLGITQTPILRRDGSIFDTPGYDLVTQRYYVKPNSFSMPDIPENPSKGDIEKAISLINETIQDFPFVDAASRANAYGLILTPIYKILYPDSYVPFSVLNSPSKGTGKTLLANICFTISAGKTGGKIPPGEKEDEWRKQITTKLLSGETAVLIDNVDTPLSSSNLCSLVTSTTWEDRLLGRNEKVNSPNLATWAITGNNIQIKGDLTRRCYQIQIDSETAKPWKRNEFKHTDLLKWATDHRGELLAALFTLCRSWIQKGCPPGSKTPTFGSFEHWSKTIGGILSNAGIEGFLSNLDTFQDEQDVEALEWGTFFSYWYTHFGDTPKTTREIVDSYRSDYTVVNLSTGKCSPLWPLPEAVEELREGKDSSYPVKKVSKLFEKQRNKCFDNLRFEKAGTDSHSKTATWRVMARDVKDIPANAGI